MKAPSVVVPAVRMLAHITVEDLRAALRSELTAQLVANLIRDLATEAFTPPPSSVEDITWGTVSDRIVRAGEVLNALNKSLAPHRSSAPPERPQIFHWWDGDTGKTLTFAYCLSPEGATAPDTVEFSHSSPPSPAFTDGVRFDQGIRSDKIVRDLFGITSSGA